MFAILFLSNGIQAQVTYSEFLNEENLHSKTEIGLELWNKYLRSDLDSLKVTAVELLMEASEQEDEFARAVGTRMLGSYLFRSDQIDQGLAYMISSREYFEKHEDYVTTSELYNEVGHALSLKAEYDEAIKSYEKSIELGKKSIDPTAEYNGEFGLGKAYIAIGDTSKGLNLIHNYKRLAIEQKKYEAAADALAYLGMLEFERNNFNLSNQYYFRSLSYSEKTNSPIHRSHAYANMGIVKFYAEEYDSSLYYLEKSMHLRKELNNPRGIVEGYINLGSYYAGTNQLDRAIDYYIKSKKLANSKGFIADEIFILEDMIEIHKELKDKEMIESLTGELSALQLIVEERQGLDQEIIKSIDLDFTQKKEKKKIVKDGGVGWKELTVAILILGLVVFFLSERKGIS